MFPGIIVLNLIFLEVFLDKFFESEIKAVLATEYSVGAPITSSPAIDDMKLTTPLF